MPKKPVEQTSPYELPSDPEIASALPAAAPPQRQHDRGDDSGDDSGDDDGAPRRRQLINRGGRDELTAAIPLLVRFKNLRQAGIVNSWPELTNLIETQGFPPGFLLSANVRAWRADDVQAWLASRPSERKVIPAAARRSISQGANSG